MKTKQIIALLSLALGFICFSSCGDDKDDGSRPIVLSYGSTALGDKLSMTTQQKERDLNVDGGDGNYFVSSSDPSVVYAELLSGSSVKLKPLAVGNAVVTVTDGSGNEFSLNVNVSYFKEYYFVERNSVIITHNGLTEVQQDEIKQAAMATIPVDVGGGYRFVYDDDNDSRKGTVLIYDANYGTGGVEAKFTWKPIENSSVSNGLYIYTIDIGGVQREFKFHPPGQGAGASSTRLRPATAPCYLKEDITQQFETTYPQAGSVITRQHCEKSMSHYPF